MNSLKRTIPFARPYRWVLFFLVITVILPVAMELIVPRMLRIVIDEGIQKKELAAVIRGSAFMLAGAVVGALATLGQGVCRARISQGLAYDMRNHMFAHIQTFSFANLDHMQTGQLMTRLASDVDLVRMFASSGLALLLRALLMIMGSVVLMLLTDWQLTLIMLALLLLAAVLIRGLLGVARPLFTLVQKELAVLNTVVQENLSGVQVVKAFVRERFEVESFGQINDDYTLASIKVGRILAVTLPALTVLTNLGLVAVIWFGGLSVTGGRFSLGELVAFNNYLLIGMAPLLLLGNILTMVSRAEASAERIWEVLDTVPSIQPVKDPHRASRLKGQVAFKEVSYRYDDGFQDQRSGDGHFRTVVDKGAPNSSQPEGGRRVLRGISFVIEPGQRLALLGATGSGKSTLLNLIPRFYDVSRGCVEIDGVDVRQWDLEALRRGIGTVLQQTTLFSGTVRENIAYGRPQASIDDVVAAAKAAQAHAFITAMPQGYKSLVEERGANLSGGQKQRIAIARALLISPAILILDDSTSAVDVATEAEIQEAIERVMKGRTTIIVAQRIQSLLSADQIIVLDDGRVAAQGTHEQLLATSPIYQEIYHSQLGNGRIGHATAGADGQTEDVT